jgi:hypothetical protein
VTTEIAEGGQAALDAFARMRDSSLPTEVQQLGLAP